MTIEQWFAAHPVARGAAYAVGIAFAGAFVNWVTFKRTAEEWDKYQAAHPRLAQLIRLSRAVFPHLRKIPALAPFIPAPESKDGGK